MSPLTIFGIGFIAVMGMMTLLWLLSLKLNDASIVDIFWGMGCVLTCWVYLVLAQGYWPRKLLITALVTMWGLRLSLHLALRNIGKGEDFRYKKMREEAGTSWWWRSYLKVFGLQGVINWFISITFLATQISPTPARLTIVDVIGVLVWLIGFLFETIGDIQLTQFRSNPSNKRKILNSGLWKYTRHPNYFGDAVAWWGYGILALGTFTVFGFLSLVGPALMTFLLIRISGVVMLEKSLKEKYGWDDYIRQTNAFFPGRPRKIELFDEANEDEE